MGICCSCCGSDDNEDGEPTARETELAERAAAKSTQISRKFSAPTLTVNESESGSIVSGQGLGLVGVALEQDAAYWEWHVSLPARQHVDTTLFGVASKKDRTFYQELEGKEPDEEGR